MKRPTVKCPQCDGAGEGLISDALFEVYTFVAKHPGSTAPEVFKGIMRAEGYVPHVTAINNRLETLFTLGLLVRTKWGRAWQYGVKQ